jgi:hypothetical protein
MSANNENNPVKASQPVAPMETAPAEAPTASVQAPATVDFTAPIPTIEGENGKVDADEAEKNAQTELKPEVNNDEVKKDEVKVTESKPGDDVTMTDAGNEVSTMIARQLTPPLAP